MGQPSVAQACCEAILILFVLGVGGLRHLLQSQEEGPRHTQKASARNRRLHVSAWRMADTAGQGQPVSDEELDKVVDNLIRSVCRQA